MRVWLSLVGLGLWVPGFASLRRQGGSNWGLVLASVGLFTDAPGVSSFFFFFFVCRPCEVGCGWVASET